MPVFLDLDNTLVDRDGAFALWARQSVPAWGGAADDVDWLIRADDGGYAARSDLARMLMDRLHLAACSVEDVASMMRSGLLEHLECYPGVLVQLGALIAAGQSLVVVTNGESKQQRAKLERTGLDMVVTGAVISAELGAKKPDPRIFEAAYALGGGDGAPWMVGDHATADIAGARALHWETVWVSHGRQWDEQWTPTLTAQEPADALALLHQSLATTQ